MTFAMLLALLCLCVLLSVVIVAATWEPGERDSDADDTDPRM